MKVLVRAFLDNNLGDDLFIYILCNRYKNTKFDIIGETKYKNIETCADNLRFISEESVLSKMINKIYKLMQKLKKEDTCNYRNYVLLNVLSPFYDENIFVTGSFFIQNPEWKKMLDEKWYDSKPYILGCNFGPYSTPEYYEEHMRQFRKAKKICFRESYSYNLFKDLENVSYAPDLVFNLDISDFDITEGDFYIISVVNLAKDNDSEMIALQKNYILLLAHLAQCIHDHGFRVAFMSFCDEQGDDQVIHEVKALLDNSDEYTEYYYSKEGIHNSLKLISECRGIVASRYHAMILGFLFEKEVVPLIYSKKMSNVLEDIGYKGRHIDLKKLMDINNENIDIMDYFYKLDRQKVCDLKDAASEHFKELDEQLDK